MLRFIIAFCFCVCLSFADEGSWAEFKVNQFKESKQVDGPKIEILKIEESQIIVKLTNETKYNFSYYGYGDKPTQYFTEDANGVTNLVTWDWCGTGKGPVPVYSENQKLIAVERPKNNQAKSVWISLVDNENKVFTWLQIYAEL